MDARPIRLLIVDDSLVVRTILTRIVEPHGDFEVVATAGNVDQALEHLARARVDIILLDLQMPGRDGLNALPELIERGYGARILIVSSICESGATATMRALTLGAADTLLKPGIGSIGAPFAKTLVARLRRIGRAPLIDRDRAMRDAAVQESLGMPTRAARKGPVGCLAIGASTGGLHALSAFFAALPERFDAPILITQHLPTVFMPYFARQLEEMSRRQARVAVEGMPLLRRQIVIAPGDAHLVVRTASSGYRIGIERGPAPSGCAPSVDPMLESVGAAFGASGVGVILSGMGRDGSIGAQTLIDCGGELLAQDAASAVIWGMPGAVARAGIASLIGTPAAIAEHIAQRAGVSPWN